MSKITIKTARAAAKKLDKARKELDGAQNRLNNDLESYNEAPARLKESQSELETAESELGAAESELTKGLDAYAKKYNGGKHIGYTSPPAQRVFDLTRQAEWAADRVKVYSETLSMTLEHYCKPEQQAIETAESDVRVCESILVNMLTALGVSELSQLPEDKPRAEVERFPLTCRARETNGSLVVLAGELVKVLSPCKIVKHKFPSLNCYHLDARTDGINIATTNLDHAYISGTATGPRLFAACVPASFLEWLKICDKSDQIALKLDPRTQVLSVTYDRTRAEFKCIDAAEYPSVEKIAELAAPALEATPEPAPVIISEVQPEPTPAPTEYIATLEAAIIYPGTAQAIQAKYAWVDAWEADPKKKIYRATIHNARADMRAELLEVCE